jgi:phage/plasmid primase-like uncharacterized protein
LTIPARAWIMPAGVLEEVELIAQELSGLAEKTRALERRLANVEKMNARLEQAALTTARALAEISGHWDAVYEAMRREESLSSGEVVFDGEGS